MAHGKTGSSWGVLLMSLFVVWCLNPTQSMGAPVPGGPGFVSIGSYEFKPLSPSATYTFTGGRLSNTTGVTEVFLAPVHLPHGATITQLILYFVDPGPEDIRVYLWSNPLDNPSADTAIVDVTSSGVSPDPRILIANTFPNGNVIDNQSNFYTVSLDLPSGTAYRIGGVRIDYSFPINLPLIMK
jgi:hypothetical protein